MLGINHLSSFLGNIAGCTGGHFVPSTTSFKMLKLIIEILINCHISMEYRQEFRTIIVENSHGNKSIFRITMISLNMLFLDEHFLGDKSNDVNVFIPSFFLSIIK